MNQNEKYIKSLYGENINTKEFQSNNFKIYSFKIFKDNEITKIIFCKNEEIKIWDFHTGECINEIKIYNIGFVNSLCLWNIDNIFVGGLSNFKLVDLKQKKEMKSLSNNYITTIKKISDIELEKSIITLESNKNGFQLILYK